MFFLDDNAIALATVVGTIVFFILAAFSLTYYLIFKRRRKEHKLEITEFRKQFENQLLQSQIEVQELTFQQIGKELHDNVGQLLSSSRMLLGLTERNLENPPDTLLTANATLGQAINELRTLSKSLDREWLEQFDFNENLKSEIARINTGNKINAVYHAHDDINFKPGEQIIFFRIVQEAIQNAIKHANPKNISITVRKDADKIVIDISDDGTGFINDNTASGMGLTNMKHRIALLSGSINWNSSNGNGTTVHIILPENKTTV